MIILAILEHWSNVLAGAESWRTVRYFHPFLGTLGYNDGLLLFGLPYAAIRRAGADPFLAAELTNMVVRAVAFLAMERFLSRALRLAWPWALLGATLATLSYNVSVQAGHAQLLAVGFAPLFGWLAWEAATEFGRGQWGRSVAWAAAAALFMGAWLLTSFYMAWFALFFMVLFALGAAITQPVAAWRTIRALPQPAWVALAAAALVAGLALIPFLVVYLPTASSTGGHSMTEIKYYSTVPLDLVLLGDSNLLWSGLDRLLQRTLRPTFPRFSEHTTGLTWVVLAVFLAGLVHLWRTRADLSLRPLRLLAGVGVLIWVLTLKVGPNPLWWIVYTTVPGAKGLRVVVRYQLFLAGPAIAVAVWYLSRARLPVPIMLGLAGLMVLEQVDVAPALGLNRATELAALQAVPPPPPGCRSFVVTRARPGAIISPEIDAIYSHNVDAMLLAEWFRLPTINGFSTFNPPGWDFVHPERPDYMDRVRTYAAAHGLSGLCPLDLTTHQWSPPLQTGPARE